MKCGGTNLSEPITFQRAEIMSYNRKLKANKHEETEHIREIQSLQNRLKQVGSW